MRIISWNIDSLNAALTSDSRRALMTRQTLKDVLALEPDVLALQETKLPYTGMTKKHRTILAELAPDYDYVYRSSQEPARKSYAGVMFLYKNHLEPAVSEPEIEAPTTMDDEGRILTLEFEEVYVTQVYTPNAGNELARLADRQIWDQQYKTYLQSLDQDKAVIAVGDFNVAHHEIDLAHPDRNHFSAGFTDEERQGFTNLLAAGFTDSFRHLHGDIEGVYTWWAQRVRTSKVNNSGWRIDYQIVSDRLKDHIQKAEMIDSGDRQDHTPILMDITI